MYKVEINGKIQYACEGALLADILNKSGGGPEHPCGGKGTCGKCLVTVNGKQELSCRYRIHSDISVILPERGDIVSDSGAHQTGRLTENLCLALDIGTTTLALALVSLDENEIIRVKTCANPQRVYGADIMSRIDYCRKNGVYDLNKRLVEAVNSMIDSFNLRNAVKLYAAGNATMLHLFFGEDCSSMGVAPYTPVFLEKREAAGAEIGLIGVSEVESLPCVSSFVGADIVAGLNFTGMPESGKYSLLVDLGTNAETVLFGNGRVLCTAAAAGPCFEGANISCGMSASDGAVYSYKNNKAETVGNLPAKGLCGTGLVDVIAHLIESGEIDEAGYMENEEFEIAEGVSVNQEDVRQYQLAKSAVYSAIMTLIETAQAEIESIETLYISGGFSAVIDIESAVKTGLLPEALKGKCAAVKNSSLLGTVKYACEKNDLSRFTKNAQYLDLSTNPVFSQLFIENMMFE